MLHQSCGWNCSSGLDSVSQVPQTVGCVLSVDSNVTSELWMELWMELFLVFRLSAAVLFILLATRTQATDVHVESKAQSHRTNAKAMLQILSLF